MRVDYAFQLINRMKRSHLLALEKLDETRDNRKNGMIKTLIRECFRKEICADRVYLKTKQTGSAMEETWQY